MPDSVYSLHGIRILECGGDGSKIRNERDAVDIVGAALSQSCALVVLPVERLGDRFFSLKSRVAGEIVQKFVNYERRLVILGDISRHLAESAALRDFVREANRGKHIWFVTDMAELAARLKPP